MLAVVALAIVALTAVVVLTSPPARPAWAAWLALMSLLVSWGRPQVVGRIQLFNSGPFIIAAIVLTGPLSAVIVSVCPMVWARNEPVKRVYNTAMRVLFAVAGSAAYAVVGGETIGSGPLEPIELLALAAQLTVAGLAVGVTNVVLVAGVVSAAGGGSIRGSAGAVGRTVVPGYAVYAVAAFLLVILWGPAGLGELAALLCLPCFIVAQWALRQHVAVWETRQQVVDALLAALDVRLPGARRQGEQVAEVAGQVAVVLGRPPAEVTTLGTAARLRDIGLLALPAPLLASDRPLDDADVAELRQHPTAARDVLEDVGFLEAALPVIEAYHERVDGTGYPRGVPGRDLPLGARVLAVADAYVNLVDPASDRRPLTPTEAVRACRRMTGHLDPHVVQALSAAVDRGLAVVTPHDRDSEPVAVRGSVADHAYPRPAVPPFDRHLSTGATSAPTTPSTPTTPAGSSTSHSPTTPAAPPAVAR